MPWGRKLNIVAGLMMDGLTNVTGWQPPLTNGVAREYSHRYMYYNNSKMMETFRHTPFPLEETLRDTIAWFSHLGKGRKKLTQIFPPDKEWAQGS